MQLCSELQKLKTVHYCTLKNTYACVAQLVVQLIRNEQVAGSNPVTSSKQMA